MATISLYDAIEQMRKISERKGSFSFSFMSYSIKSGASKGIVEIDSARMSKGNPAGMAYGEYLLNFVDLSTGRPFRCWKPCLMFFNQQKIQLK